MAITTPTLVERVPVGAVLFAAQAVTVDGTPILMKAPSAGTSIYLTKLVIALGDALGADSYVSLTDGLNTYFGPIALQADGEGSLVRHWRYPLKYPEAYSLYVQSRDVAGADGPPITAYVEGFTA